MKTKIKISLVILFAGFLVANWVFAADGVENSGPETSRFAIHAAFARAPLCGNGFLEINEQCDDGNRIDGDSCNNRCEASEAFMAATLAAYNQKTALRAAAPADADAQTARLYFGPWTKSTLLILLVIGISCFLEIVKIPHFIKRRLPKRAC